MNSFVENDGFVAITVAAVVVVDDVLLGIDIVLLPWMSLRKASQQNREETASNAVIIGIEFMILFDVRV